MNEMPPLPTELDLIPIPVATRVNIRQKLPYSISDKFTPLPQKKKQCRRCGWIGAATAASKHWIKKHTDPTFTCTICDAAFHFKSDFIPHANAHAGIKPFECNKCKKHFARKTYLNKHQKKCKY